MELFKLDVCTKEKRFFKIFNSIEAVKEMYMQLRDEMSINNTDCDLVVFPMYFDGPELVESACPVIHFRNNPEGEYRNEEVNL